MTYDKLNTWIINLGKTKPYRIMLKNGMGFYELVFLYHDFHHSEKIYQNDMKDDLVCQRKILEMCLIFEKNIKLRVF